MPADGDGLVLVLLEGILPGEDTTAQRAVRIEAHPVVPIVFIQELIKYLYR